jgi:hypothetical protein
MSYLTDILYIEKFLRGSQSKVAVAQEGGFMSSVAGGIKDYLASQWDPAHPVASIVNFMGPAVFFKINPILGILYEVAEALGWDSKGFWTDVGKNLVEFMQSMTSSGHPPTEEEFHQKAQEATNNSFDAHFTGQEDPAKLKEVAQKAQQMGAFASSHPELQGAIVKRAALLRGLLSRLFGRVIPAILKTGLYALMLNAAGGATRGALGIKSEPGGEGSSSSPSPSKEREPIYSLKLNPNLPEDLTEFHRNDLNGVWIETGNIQNIQEYLIDWILQAYPDQAPNKEDIINSPSFIEVENLFRDRNKMASGLNVYSVPRPFQKKLDIVAYIINGYLKSKGK